MFLPILKNSLFYTETLNIFQENNVQELLVSHLQNKIIHATRYIIIKIHVYIVSQYVRARER